MATQIVRPLGNPVRTSAFSDILGDSTGAPDPTFIGSGSLSDDSDSTATAQQIGPSKATSAALAVDFPAVPDLLIPTAANLTFGMSMRVTLTSSIGFDGVDVAMVFATRGGVPLVSLLPPFIHPLEVDTPTTYSTDTSFYTLFGNAESVRDEGFTLAYGLRATAPPSATIELTTFEVAFEFNVAAVVVPYVAPQRVEPSLRMFQRGGSGGVAGVPRFVGSPVAGLRQGPGAVR